MKINDLILERYALGEATEAEKALVESNQAYLDRALALKAENEAFLERYPVRVVSAQIKERLEGQKKKSRPLIVLLPRIALSLSAVFLISFGVTQLGTDSDTRTKGEEHLTIYHKSQGKPEPLKPNDLVQPYEELQIAYWPQSKPYGVIFSVDSNKQITLHFPSSYTAEPSLAKGDQVLLQYAYQIDNTPGVETFYFVTSKKTFSVKDLLKSAEQSLKSAKPLQFGSDFTLSSLSLKKAEAK